MNPFEKTHTNLLLKSHRNPDNTLFYSFYLLNCIICPFVLLLSSSSSCKELYTNNKIRVLSLTLAFGSISASPRGKRTYLARHLFNVSSLYYLLYIHSGAQITPFSSYSTQTSQYLLNAFHSNWITNKSFTQSFHLKALLNIAYIQVIFSLISSWKLGAIPGASTSLEQTFLLQAQ